MEKSKPIGKSCYFLWLDSMASLNTFSLRNNRKCMIAYLILPRSTFLAWMSVSRWARRFNISSLLSIRLLCLSLAPMISFSGRPSFSNLLIPSFIPASSFKTCNSNWQGQEKVWAVTLLYSIDQLRKSIALHRWVQWEMLRILLLLYTNCNNSPQLIQHWRYQPWLPCLSSGIEAALSVNWWQGWCFSGHFYNI